jgi:hypothetical protein
MSKRSALTVRLRQSAAIFASSKQDCSAKGFRPIQSACTPVRSKAADPDIPILKETKAEYAKLQ